MEQHAIGWTRFMERHPEVGSLSELKKRRHICYRCPYNGESQSDYMECVYAFVPGMEDCPGLRVEI
jgi:hypothetical protein